MDGSRRPAFLAAGMLTPPLAKRFPAGLVMGAGLALAAVAFGTLTQVVSATVETSARICAAELPPPTTMTR